MLWTESYRYDNSPTRPLRTNTLYTNYFSLTYTLTHTLSSRHPHLCTTFQEIAESLGVDLGQITVGRFADGEVNVQ